MTGAAASSPLLNPPSRVWTAKAIKGTVANANELAVPALGGQPHFHFDFRIGNRSNGRGDGAEAGMRLKDGCTGTGGGAGATNAPASTRCAIVTRVCGKRQGREGFAGGRRLLSSR